MWRPVAAVALGVVAVFSQSQAGHSRLVAGSIAQVRDGAASRPGTAIIRGRIVADDAVFTPLPKARVLLGGASVAPVFTAADGGFEFVDLPNGRYTLTAEKTGYARTHYGARRELDIPLPLELVDGALLERVEIRMPKGAAIAGRIVDERGDPAIAAYVNVSPLKRVGSDWRVSSLGHPRAQTNDLGEFRVGGLAAGLYSVCASEAMANSGVQGGPSDWVRETGWARTCYPTGTGMGAATPIALAAGEERTGVDLMLTPVRPSRVTVTWSGPMAPSSAGGASTMARAAFLRESVLDGTVELVISVGQPASSPGRIMQVLSPGEWIAQASINNGPSTVTRFTVRDGEEVTLDLPLPTPARIRGRVVLEGSGLDRRAVPSGLRVWIRSAGADAAIAASAFAPAGSVPVSPDGSFEITPVLGTVSPYLVAAPAGWAVKTVRWTGRDLTDDPLLLTGGEDIRDVEIVLIDRIATLAVTTMEPDGRPVAGCAVALFPQGDEIRFGSRRMRLERTDQGGRAALNDLPAGDYWLAATTDVDAANWQTIASLNLLRLTAQKITLDDTVRNLTLPCQAAP